MANAVFLKSAVLPEDYPEANRPEIALAGRSNAGKSTLLNSLYGGKKVAKVSGSPGKTRLLNFFDVGENYRMVDLPGYGYAARAHDERRQWGEMVDRFFNIRTTLVGLVIVCDIRREWTDDEEMIVELAEQKSLKVLCALTKSDKLNQSETQLKLNNWLKSSQREQDFFHPTSALENKGILKLEDFLFKEWVQPNINKYK